MTSFLCLVLILVVCTWIIRSEKTIQSYQQIAALYYQKCPVRRRCDGSKVEHDLNYVLSQRTQPCCDECSCEVSCIEEGTCCPDKLVLLLHSHGNRLTDALTCISPSFKRRRRGNGIMAIHSCPKSLINETVKQLCIDFSTTTSGSLSLNESGPVTDKGWQNTTYDNIYCALCNGLSKNDVLFWLPTHLECEQGYFLPVDEEELLKHIWSTNCNVLYSPPNDTFVPYCPAFTSQCNTTGKWPKYDALVEEACHSFTAVYNGTYQNVFCYECNEIFELAYVCPGKNQLKALQVSFSAVLNSMTNENSVDDVMSDECQNGHIYDNYQMKCIQIHCFFGGRYYNGTCVQGLIGRSWGFRFQANLKLTPQTQLQEDAASALVEYIYNDTFYFIPYTPCKQTFFFEKQTQNLEYIANLRYELLAEIYDYEDTAFIQIILGLHQTIRNYSYDNSSFSFYMELYASAIWDVKTDYIPTTKNKLVLFKDVQEICELNPKLDTTVVLTRALHCPLVQLNKRTFTWKFKWTAVYLQQLDLLIPDINILKAGLDDSSILICADIYFEGVKKIIIVKNKHMVSEAVYQVGILTLACTIVSVVCLTVTIFTYILFPSLLTQPGVNNIILSSVLIIAQCLFQFGVGQKQHVSHTSCVLIGILVHFFWLFTISWMNVCSIHMTRVFRSLKPKTLHDHRKRTSSVYLIYSFVTSSFFVVLNIVVSRITSDGNIFGYAEGSLCYISNPQMIGFTFALPVGFLVLSNCLLFLYTICLICTIKEIPKANRKSRNFLVIYVRLSTITGLTWIFGFVYSLSSLIIFEYLFVILNSGQGVFVMLAFVINKKVLSMYKSKVLIENLPVTELSHQTKENSFDITDN